MIIVTMAVYKLQVLLQAYIISKINKQAQQLVQYNYIINLLQIT